MGAIAQLSHEAVDVEPGRTATFAIRVRNGGTVVDRFSFEALGTAALAAARAIDKKKELTDAQATAGRAADEDSQRIRSFGAAQQEQLDKFSEVQLTATLEVERFAAAEQTAQM